MSPRYERDWRLYAADIIEACGKVRRFVAGMTFETFVADERTQDAVMRNIEIIGEAAKNIPDDVVAGAPEIEWRNVRGMRDILAHGIDVRMIAVALRCRRRGLALPTVGVGQWFDHIRHNFNQPDFKLGRVFPWIPEAERLLAQGDVLTLYRQYVLGATWTYLKKRAEDYYFSFEAVVLYIARWDIIRHWQQLQAERGRAIFETLVTEALGAYANIYS